MVKMALSAMIRQVMPMTPLEGARSAFASIGTVRETTFGAPSRGIVAIVFIGIRVKRRFSRSAGFQPAGSPISNRQDVRQVVSPPNIRRLAGWKPCDTAGWKPALQRLSSFEFPIRVAGVL